MPSSRWEWNPTSRRYRDTSTGRYLSGVRIAGLRNEFAASQRTQADIGAAAIRRGDWTVRRWELETRTHLKRVYLAQYMLGRGGRNAMTQADYGRVGAMLKEQYDFLRSFALDVQAGRLSEAQIAARTQLYHESSIQAFERGKVVAYSGDLTLPVYPADGRTRCRARCRCRWRIVETKTMWKAYYRRNSRAESCGDCIDREVRYNPYVQLKTTAT